MGNALAREIIPCAEHARRDFNLDSKLTMVSMNVLLQLLAKARTRMKCVSMNPDARAVEESLGLMHELNVRGPDIESPASLKAIDIPLEMLFFQCSMADQEEFSNSFRFYVPDPSAEIKTKSRIHFLTPAIEDDVVGIVLFFDERAADLQSYTWPRFAPTWNLT